MTHTHVFYQPGNAWAIDVAVDSPNGMVAFYSRESLEDISKRYPGAVLVTSEEAQRMMVEAVKTSPIKISEEDFTAALEVLPPLHWQIHGDCSSFMSSEFHSGNVTNIYY